MDNDLNSVVFVSLLMIMFLIIVIGNEIYIKHKNTNQTKKNTKKYRILLCEPSGEIIKISNKKWNKLIRNDQIKWNEKLRYYMTPDENTKYKLKK